MELSLHLENTHVLVTGGAGFIGSAVVNAFLVAGSNVTIVDVRRPEQDYSKAYPSKTLFLTGDITNESELEDIFAKAADTFGPVSCTVALASLDLSFVPHHKTLADMPVEQWRRTHRVNVEGTFLTAKTWMRQLMHVKTNGANAPQLKNVNLIIIGSECGVFGSDGNADYAAGKSAVQYGLLKSITADASRLWEGARVNAIAPGCVDTAQFRRECQEDPKFFWKSVQATVPLKKAVTPDAVAKSVLFLASDAWSGYITGEVLNVNSGKQGVLFWEKES